MNKKRIVLTLLFIFIVGILLISFLHLYSKNQRLERAVEKLKKSEDTNFWRLEQLAEEIEVLKKVQASLLPKPPEPYVDSAYIKNYYLTNIDEWLDNLSTTQSKISVKVKEKTEEYLRKNEKSLFDGRYICDWIYLTPETILVIYPGSERYSPRIFKAKLIKKIGPEDLEIITDLSALNEILKIDALKIFWNLDKNHRDIIPHEGIHGGTMHFGDIAVLAPKTFYVEYSDGHIGGGMILKEKSPKQWEIIYDFGLD